MRYSVCLYPPSRALTVRYHSGRGQRETWSKRDLVKERPGQLAEGKTAGSKVRPNQTDLVRFSPNTGLHHLRPPTPPHPHKSPHPHPHLTPSSPNPPQPSPPPSPQPHTPSPGYARPPATASRSHRTPSSPGPHTPSAAHPRPRA